MEHQKLLMRLRRIKEEDRSIPRNEDRDGGSTLVRERFVLLG
jgi:hypothetical protein